MTIELSNSSRPSTWDAVWKKRACTLKNSSFPTTSTIPCFGATGLHRSKRWRNFSRRRSGRILSIEAENEEFEMARTVSGNGDRRNLDGAAAAVDAAVCL